MRLLIASIAAVVSIAAQEVDVNRIGPAVGASAPAFALTDQNGREQTLASVAGPQGTMLVFFRSADW